MLSVDLLLLGVNLISANILTVDICAPNSILVTTIKDVLNLQISLTDKSLLAERFHKIVSAPGTRQSCMAIVNAETIVNGAVTQRRALAVAGDSCGVAVVDCDANEFCGALQIGEQVTSMHSNMSAKWGCTLAVGTTKGNVFVAERFMQEGQKCDLVAALKNRVEDLKISPNGAYLIVISEEHNCALYERGEEGKFETSCSRKYRGCDIVFRLEKEGPTYPISVSFAEDSCSFIAYSNRSTIFIRNSCLILQHRLSRDKGTEPENDIAGRTEGAGLAQRPQQVPPRQVQGRTRDCAVLYRPGPAHPGHI